MQLWLLATHLALILRLSQGHHGWLHWFDKPIPDGGRPNTDIWPDISEYSPSELYPAPGLKHANGEQVFLFSSRHAKTVQRYVPSPHLYAHHHQSPWLFVAGQLTIRA